MEKTEKILVTGAAGMVGSAIIRALLAQGFTNIVGTIHRAIPDFGPEANEKVRLERLNLLDQQAVGAFFAKEQPRQVFLAAAKVGGIHANNTYPADFIHDNLVIQTNVIHNAYLTKVDRLLFLGSSCIYPKLCPQPIKEEYLLTGPLEETNKAYALAKIAGIEMCWSYNKQYGCQFIPVMPTNLYGVNDSFDLENSHVLPALIRKFHLAKMAMEGNLRRIQQDEAQFGPIPLDIKQALCLKLDSSGFSDGFYPSSSSSPNHTPKVIVWGTGTPKREFLHVDDLAAACTHILSLPNKLFVDHLTQHDKPLLNIGAGVDLTTSELAELVKNVVGVNCEIVLDTSRPDGTPRKVLDITRVQSLNWTPQISLRKGIERVYQWYEQQSEK